MDRTESNAGSNEMDEQRFLHMFSKELAEALRAKDEEEAEERDRLRSNNRSLGRVNEGEQWERVRSTYVQLCHDDPMVSGGDGDCRRLAKALIPKQKISGKDKNTNKLALSSRLVGGVLQATARAGAKCVSSSSTTQTNQKNNVSNVESESMFGSSSVTTSEGYAEIAFSMFVEGPYRCIQEADNVSYASKFLGSFHPPDTSHVPNEKLPAEEKSRLVDEATAQIVEGMENMAMDGEGKTTEIAPRKSPDDASSSSSEFFHANKAQNLQQSFEDDNESMQEVFAEESDPDDFEYESSYNPHATTSDVQTIFGQKSTNDDYDDIHDLSFNPLQLSEPNVTNQTWEGARKSIYYLLSNATYGKMFLGSLSSRAWSEGGISDTLSDLSFMLLLENSKRDLESAVKSNSLLSYLREDEYDNSEDIASLWDRPLFLLRDRALDKNRDHDALPAYIQLLAAFLSHTEQDVMSTFSSPLGKSDAESMLPPATAVGLSSLAALCTSKEMISASSGRMCSTSVWSVCPREEMKKGIMSSLGSLSSIVECVRPKKSIFAKSKSAKQEDESAKVESPWIRTAVCIIPVVEYLTNLQARFDFQPLFEGGGSRSATLSDSDVKAISESGLFRELLSMYTATRKEDGNSLNSTKSKAEDVVRMQLLRTIFTLSAQSPEVFGRYAVRVPDFAKEVHSSTFMEEHPVDGILWTSIGSSLLENKSDALKPRLKLRTTSKLSQKGPIETRSLAERSMEGFETMCKTSKEALQNLTQCVHSADDSAISDEKKAKYDACRDALADITRFSNCLSNCPSATQMWLESLKNKEDSTQKATASIVELKAMLVSLPYFSSEIKEVPHKGHKKDDDDECTENEEDDPTDVHGEASQKSHTLKQMQREYGIIASSIRSSVKVIVLALESQRGTGLSLKGPGRCDVSSKTD